MGSIIYIITRRKLAEYTGWNNYQIIKGLEELESHEYIQTTLGKEGKKGVIKGYRLMIDLQLKEEEIDLGLTEL